MHPTYYAKAAKAAEAEVAELKANIATLTARLDALAPPPANTVVRNPALPAGAPVGAYVDASGLARDQRGNLLGIKVETTDEYLARVRADQDAYKAKEAARLAKQREGLEGGLWRDDFGLVRTPLGELASSAEIQARRVDAVREAQGQEHREYLSKIGMPTRLPGHVSLPVQRTDPSDLAE
jgi:hypothetical protein